MKRICFSVWAAEPTLTCTCDPVKLSPLRAELAKCANKRVLFCFVLFNQIERTTMRQWFPLVTIKNGLETETVFAKHQRSSDMLPTRTYSQYKHVPPNDFQLNNRPHTANTAVVPLKRMTLCTVVILTWVILAQRQWQDYTIYSFTELYLTVKWQTTDGERSVTQSL